MKASILVLGSAIGFGALADAAPGETPGANVSALCNAIRTRHWSEASRLVKDGTSVTNVNEEGRTALGMLVNRWFGSDEDYATRRQFLDLVLERGADPLAATATDFYPKGDHSAVEQAFANVDPSLADILLTNRPSAARRTPLGDTALHLAAQAGRTNAMDFLLAAGFSVNQTNDHGLTSLQSIVGLAMKGTFLRASNPPPRFVHWHGKGDQNPRPGQVADLLLDRGAALDVCSAAGLGLTNELAALLRARPSEARTRDGFGRTPLHYAAGVDQGQAVALLLQAGGDPSAQTTRLIPRTTFEPETPIGSSPLHFASRRECLEATELLLKAGAPAGQADAKGNTPLHLAAYWGATEIPRRLIAAHAPLDILNEAGRTPLRVAVESGSYPNVELLLDAGARPEAGLKDETLLHVAAAAGEARDFVRRGGQTIPVLLRHGLAVDSRDRDGLTPFHRAVTTLNWAAMNLLLTNGADVDAVDALGNGVLHLFATQNVEMVQQELPWPEPRGGIAAGPPVQQVRAAGLTNISVTSWLIKHGANLNRTNQAGETALDVLCNHRWGYWDKRAATNRAALLLTAGANTARLSEAGRDFLRAVQTSR